MLPEQNILSPETQDPNILGDPNTEIVQGAEILTLDPGDGEQGGQTEDEGQDLSNATLRLTLLKPNGQGGFDEQEEEVPGAQLEMLVSKGKDYDNLAYGYRQLEQQLQQSQQQLQQNQHLQQAVASDKFLATVVHLRLQGYEPQQILQQITGLLPVVEQDPTFDSIDPEQKKFFDAMLAKERAERQRIEQQLQSMQGQSQMQVVFQHNNNELNQAVTRGGFEYKDDPVYAQKVAKAIQEIYPNVDFRTQQMTPAMADVIVAQAKLPKRTTPQKTQVGAIQRQNKAPRIISGKSSQGQRQVQTSMPGGEEFSPEKRKQKYANWGK